MQLVEVKLVAMGLMKHPLERAVDKKWDWWERGTGAAYTRRLCVSNGLQQSPKHTGNQKPTE